MKKYLFVANQGSGSMQVAQFHALLKDRLEAPSISYNILTLEKKRQDISVYIEEQIKKQKPDCVIACGGDGTVTAVGHALRDLDIPMGIIPLGTANIFAKCLGIPLQTAEALECVLKEQPTIRKLDAMECGGRLYFLHITLGVSALITYRTPQDEKRRFGIFAYIVRLLKYLNVFSRKRYTFFIDGEPIKKRVTEVVIANTDMFFSKPFRLGEDISMDDGQLDLLAFSPRNWMDHFRFISYFTFGRPSLRSAIYFRESFQNLRIESKKPMIVHADGEIIGRTPIDVVVRPKILRVITGE